MGLKNFSFGDFFSRSRRKILLSAAVTALAVVAALVIIAHRAVYLPVDKNNFDTVEFIVEKGQGVKEIGERLEQAGLISGARWFELYIWHKKQGGKLQAGKYALARNLNIPIVIEIITGGKIVVNEERITFPEGFALAQIAARFAERGLAPAGAALAGEKIGDYQVQYKFLSDAPAGAGLEGFLFPDTYIFGRDDDAIAVVKKFLDNFDKKLTPDWRAEISRQGRKIYEVVILASIIQQEAVDEKDMPLVAGVFANRLRIGMALESDATVNYVTGKKMRQPLYDDLKVKSPYNTYLYRGLPPTPIANPGAAAIVAAINPAVTDYLYFLHPLSGETVFSRTFDEHNRNKAKWLK